MIFSRVTVQLEQIGHVTTSGNGNRACVRTQAIRL